MMKDIGIIMKKMFQRIFSTAVKNLPAIGAEFHKLKRGIIPWIFVHYDNLLY